MVSSVSMDPNTGLEVALDSEANIVAYNLKTKNENRIVIFLEE